MESLNSLLQHLSSPENLVALVTSVSSAAFAAWIVNDYREWKAFGTGGTPANFAGYLRITQFRIRRFFTFDDLKDASSLSGTGTSYLKTALPKRHGQPPKMISRTLPQRHHPEPLEADISRRLHFIPHDFVERYPDLLTLDKSITEGRSTDAVYAKPDLPSRGKGAQDPVLGHEIAHVHPAENSLHVWLTEADCKEVVSAGWGERFPLASLNMVHAGWTFLYAPRSMRDVEVIEQIVLAGIQNVTGAGLGV